MIRKILAVYAVTLLALTAPARATTTIQPGIMDTFQFTPGGPAYFDWYGFIPERRPDLAFYEPKLLSPLPPPITYNISITFTKPLLYAGWDTGYYYYENYFIDDGHGGLKYDGGVDFFESYPNCIYGGCHPVTDSGNTYSFQITDTPTYDGFATIRWTRASDFGGAIDPKDFDGFAVVSVISSLVPEPSTWMMLLLGFTSIGVALRRKRAVSTQARPFHQPTGLKH